MRRGWIIVSLLAALALLLQGWTPAAAVSDARTLGALAHAYCDPSQGDAAGLAEDLITALGQDDDGGQHCEEHCPGCCPASAAAPPAIASAELACGWATIGSPAHVRVANPAHRPRGPPLGSRAPPLSL